MTKINPVINLKPIIGKAIKSPTAKFPVVPYKYKAAAIGSAGFLISSILQEFNKSVEQDNYFQFKTNPETGKALEPDIFQRAAGINLAIGNNVLVTAPTGTGKTAIAEYIMTKNLKEGKRTFYTTPLKALSNEKFLDFSKIYGEENVGILTGDTKINTQAPIIVMTTEVYRNMAATGIFNFDPESKKGIPAGVKTVIFDELQYLGDVDRGGIWEQSIMFTPKNIQTLSLSATIGNNEEINNWMSYVKNRQEGISVTPDTNYRPNLSKSGECVLINVPPENRHVPLHFEPEHAVPEIKIPRGGSKAEKIKAKKEGARISQSIYAKPNDETYKKLTAKLNSEGKLPAIYFVFSKKECRHLLKFLSTEAEILTSEDETKKIKEIINRYKKEGIYLGESLNIDALEKGYAIHNAGLLPSQKRLIEELFQKKLIKVVLATETLSAGINMPAKTTVISSPRKPASTSDGGDDKKRTLTPNEFHQMAGRAGRRGIDTEGFCIPLSCNAEQTKVYNELMASPSNRLDSNLNIDFSFIANYMTEFSSEDEFAYIFSKSLYAYKTPEKIDELMNNIKEKQEILKKEGFVSEDGNLTIKGKLLGYLNGYEQIPIINLLADKTFENLNPIQTAGIIGGLANIEYNTKGELPPKPFDIKEQNEEAFVDASMKAYKDIRFYNTTVEKLYPSRELNLSAKVIDHIYAWAKLNSENDDSKENWKKLYTGDMRFSIRDEGTLFKEITMTTDLLKQLVEIAEAGFKLTNDIYYSETAQKFKQALALIQKEPASDNL